MNTRERIENILNDIPLSVCLSRSDITEIASALSTTLKPSWSELELDKVLPAKRDKEKVKSELLSQEVEDAYRIGYNSAIIDCKQALLGQGGEK